MPDLRLIDGGGGGREFRENPYASALWAAIYPQPAHDYKEIASRMSEAHGERLSISTANNTIHHVRKHAAHYRWTIPHVQKGRYGEQRRYLPVKLDDNSPALRTEIAKECLRSGAHSSCLTVASMAEHEAVAIDAAADTSNLTADQKRRLRAAAGMFTAAAEMARKVLSNVA